MTITIRPFDSGDYPTIAAIRNAVYPDYPLTAEEWRHMDEQRDPKNRMGRWVAETDGRVAGFAHFMHMTWMYHPQKFLVEITVHPDFQGRGIGGTLYTYLLDQLQPLDPLVLRTAVREDIVRGMNFAAARGFVEDMRTWESHLDLTSFDPAPFAEAGERGLTGGITIKTLRELETDPERNQKLYTLYGELMADVPLPEPYTHPSYETWFKGAFETPGLLPDGYFIACDGSDYVGVTSLWRRLGANYLDTGLTAVRRSHRRRGIALALKLRALAYARTTDAPKVTTGNASNNRPMLAINEMLGFKRQPAWLDLSKKLKEEG